MAFRNTAAVPQDESWKASGFINLYLPSKDGKRRKLGAIALRDSKASEKALREWLDKDPKNAQTLLAKLIVDYQSATPSEGSAFAIE